MSRRKIREARSKLMGTKQVLRDLNSAAHREVHFDDPGISIASTRWLAVKTADENVISSITLQDDDHLFYYMNANETWFFRLGLWMTDASGSTANVKLAFTIPTGASMLMSYVWNDTGSLDMIKWTNSGGAQLLDSSLAGDLFQPWGIVVNGSTSGNFQVQWAQETSTASNLTMKTGSFIEGRRIL